MSERAGAESGTLEQLPLDEPFPGVRRRTIDAAGATVTSYAFAPGARFPLHRHPQEQVTLVHEGSVRMRLDDAEEELDAGSWSLIPGDVPHGITAGEQGARLTAVVVPRRAEAGAYEVLDG
jgi:quercetin dioxygenase-like cupin family protein